MAPVSEGSYLSNDKVPASLLPILRQAFKEYVPVALDTIQRVSRWVASNPQAAISRLLGTQRFQIGDASETRRVWTCIQYMMQAAPSLSVGDRPAETQWIPYLGRSTSLATSHLRLPAP